MTLEDNINEYNVEGYDVVNVNRTNKRGGGVMMYVLKSIQFKLVKNMSEAIDNLYECVTIEIETVKSNNTVITCMYRAPGSNIDTYLEYIENLLLKLNNKTFFLIGDFNINLINYESHSGTKMFMNTLFSYGLHPLINKPTRITLESCTLIDNIFTNAIEEFNSGIFINDISDHLPVFTIFPLGFRQQNVSKPCQAINKHGKLNEIKHTTSRP
jgi:exonuclease III